MIRLKFYRRQMIHFREKTNLLALLSWLYKHVKIVLLVLARVQWKKFKFLHYYFLAISYIIFLTILSTFLRKKLMDWNLAASKQQCKTAECGRPSWIRHKTTVKQQASTIQGAILRTNDTVIGLFVLIWMHIHFILVLNMAMKL